MTSLAVSLTTPGPGLVAAILAEFNATGYDEIVVSLEFDESLWLGTLLLPSYNDNTLRVLRGAGPDSGRTLLHATLFGIAGSPAVQVNGGTQFRLERLEFLLNYPLVNRLRGDGAGSTEGWRGFEHALRVIVNRAGFGLWAGFREALANGERIDRGIVEFAAISVEWLSIAVINGVGAFVLDFPSSTGPGYEYSSGISPAWAYGTTQPLFALNWTAWRSGSAVWIVVTNSGSRAGNAGNVQSRFDALQAYPGSQVRLLDATSSLTSATISEPMAGVDAPVALPWTIPFGHIDGMIFKLDLLP